MTYNNSIGRAASFLMVVASAAVANASVVFNNFLEPGDNYSVDGRVLEGPDVHNVADIDQAVSFTVGANNYLLTSIWLGLYVDSSPFNGSGTINVEIASNSGGLPGSVLLTLPGSLTQPPNQQILKVFSPAVFELHANTTYWVIADTQGHFDGAWDFPDPNHPNAGPVAGRSNNGAWSLQDPADGRMALKVNGNIDRTPVPDSGSTFAFLGAGVTGLMFFARGRQSGAKA